MSWIAFADDRSLTDILLRDALTPQHSSRLNSSMRFVWLTIYFLGLGWSAIHPHDYFTWLLEASPALLGVLILAATQKRFPLTALAYTLILIHCMILFIGAHYTYAQVDTFKFIRDFFSWQRNNYDKLGHFAQGFVPAIIAREILIRKNVINGRGWLNLFVLSICLAFSALYELFEWGVAVATGDSAESFLGTQGYVWDTQSDMAFALLGAILSLVIFSNLHDQQLQSLRSQEKVN
jgi:putative membrane protein